MCVCVCVCVVGRCGGGQRGEEKDKKDDREICLLYQSLETESQCGISPVIPFASHPRDEIVERLSQPPFSDSFVAVRSSGTDEDSAAHSFAGNRAERSFRLYCDMWHVCAIPTCTYIQSLLTL